MLIREISGSAISASNWTRSVWYLLEDLNFYLHCDICNFADDAAPYVWDRKLAFVPEKLEDHSNIAIKRFDKNDSEMNLDKCNLFISGGRFEQVSRNVGNNIEH